jgi:hypothetical protein
MSEAEWVAENSEHPLSAEELAGLRRLLGGMPTNQLDLPDHSVQATELRSTNARLDLTQKVVAGFSIVVMTCVGYLLIQFNGVSVSLGKIETRLELVDERFDRVDKRFDTLAALMARFRLRQQGLFRE